MGGQPRVTSAALVEPTHILLAVLRTVMRRIANLGGRLRYHHPPEQVVSWGAVLAFAAW